MHKLLRAINYDDERYFKEKYINDNVIEFKEYDGDEYVKAHRWVSNDLKDIIKKIK